MRQKAYLWLLNLVIIVALSPGSSYSANVLAFQQSPISLRKDVRDYLNRISPAEWMEFLTSGIDSINRQKRLEDNLLSSDITVQNGSLSHAQLLDTLPNEKSQLDSDIALKILKGTLFMYNSKCLPRGISGDECRAFLETKPLPEGSPLSVECNRVLQSPRTGHHAFRRLLPRNYKNGFHEMFGEDKLPGAWSISMALYDQENDSLHRTGSRTRADTDDSDYSNLVLVQFSQFVEHDMSKTVSQSMSNGYPIECCNRNQNNLQPRFHHPLCAPILYNDKNNWPNCLNYVRSALAVGERCNFGSAEQLNQATGNLDLSQLYGFTDAAERKMRTLTNGALKSSLHGKLLPMTSDDEDHRFCAWNNSANVTTCFIAGDSRVNSSPLSILVYTIFMRNHNRIAAELLSRHKTWTDEQLYQAAKAVNIDIYRRVIMREWLPEVLGQKTAADVLATPPVAADERLSEVSNEFAVAAIRFYLSMLPNALHNLASDNKVGSSNNNILPLTNIFELQNEIYKPQLQYTSKKLSEILQSLLHERAMKMDAFYVGAIVWHEPTKPTHADVLAFDIQRGRDHGLQPYYKYLEACGNKKNIAGWSDFEAVMPKKIVDKLRNVYQRWRDVDLLIGGISEQPVDGTVGPTFKCILAEQFSKIHQRQQQRQLPTDDSLLRAYSAINGTKLLCLNSDMVSVPQNIFRLQSNSNRLVKCDDI
ncbi:chorion peroxidase [Drosophila hydei]|uniref:Chorion peroxidase n=1 Tax=Drosophila hydei TaxID=7224 RepID=A0A6J1MDT4_DROHY|nr:chorion peroxidase [Drosophila hydei]XP_023175157.2 chorion peroxidase [Drosophila hydei]